MRGGLLYEEASGCAFDFLMFMLTMSCALEGRLSWNRPMRSS